jgi:tRNA(Ile)-lysidine synthase
VAAVSGGADSVALANLLLELAEHGGFAVVALAHLNHQLRATAARDEDFCRELATSLGLPLVVERGDVAARAAADGLSLEDAARRVRYAFLARTAVAVGADRIAVGHTLDDQAETVLLKLIRGAGPAGVGGISPSKGAVVRPLLEVTKAELQTYLRSRGLRWVEDETNLDCSNPRNRIRHAVLPELERTYPGAARNLARAGEVARDDSRLLETIADRIAAVVTITTAAGVELDAVRLSTEPRAIVRRVLMAALRAIAGDREVGLEHVRAAEEVLARARGGTDVPGGRVELRREKLVLSRAGRMTK